MEHKETQKAIVLAKLKKDGSVSNVWAINQRILRLAAIVCDIRAEGTKIATDYQNVTGRRNCVYRLAK